MEDKNKEYRRLCIKYLKSLNKPWEVCQKEPWAVPLENLDNFLRNEIKSNESYKEKLKAVKIDISDYRILAFTVNEILIVFDNITNSIEREEYDLTGIDTVESLIDEYIKVCTSFDESYDEYLYEPKPLSEL